MIRNIINFREIQIKPKPLYTRSPIPNYAMSNLPTKKPGELFTTHSRKRAMVFLEVVRQCESNFSAATLPELETNLGISKSNIFTILRFLEGQGLITKQRFFSQDCEESKALVTRAKKRVQSQLGRKYRVNTFESMVFYTPNLQGTDAGTNPYYTKNSPNFKPTVIMEALKNAAGAVAPTSTGAEEFYKKLLEEQDAGIQTEETA